MSRSTAPRVHVVSLGCPKNTVDSERMVAIADQQGLAIARDPSEAEVIVVNTCGFIEPAKRESIDTMLRMAEQKHSGRCQTLVMAGCLSQRYPEDLARELPEVDHFLGTADLGRLGEVLARAGGGVPRENAPIERVSVGAPEGLEEADYRRQLIGPPHTSYLKISEGCNRPCAFCSIPIMRGRQRSRSVESLVDEAKQLVQQGVRELILVAQDSTAYGSDLPRGSANLELLLRALDQIEGLSWVRVHYAYPSMIYPPLAEAMAELQSVVPYIDMPIQHVDDELLRRMRRGYTGRRAREAVTSLRERIPGLWVRTTMLVGHPGETDEAHQALLRFVEELSIDHLGAFVFSPEEGTSSVDQPDEVPEELAEQRRAELLERQQRISRERLAKLRGQTLEVMIDGVSDESEFLLVGRHGGQSPEIDGHVILADAEGQPGELVRAEVRDSADYDLVAHALPTA
ncbi:MAG: 30S ribosomal protein S12 methylthiotransferase RimO [Proteobacteria bacterium]|nr:MAG: 30S ribosomal protein S12 methylthiotransferase RimO [Pseudomonadota bacterium]PIE17918.1 MAG: 30S ribosomal protein S12 methylthiotransferase RimO [Pseudomonadota bacterium]